MNSTLTAARAALYWGAKVQTTGGKKVDLTHFSADTPHIAWNEGDQRKWGSSRWEWLRLELRTVEQLTDEELTEVVKLANMRVWYLESQFGRDWGNYSIVGKRIVKDIVCDYGDPITISPENTKRIINYLRSIHVDIDNAIADGWAVKEVSHE